MMEKKIAKPSQQQAKLKESIHNQRIEASEKKAKEVKLVSNFNMLTQRLTG